MTNWQAAVMASAGYVIGAWPHDPYVLVGLHAIGIFVAIAVVSNVVDDRLGGLDA